MSLHCRELLPQVSTQEDWGIQADISTVNIFIIDKGRGLESSYLVGGGS